MSTQEITNKTFMAMPCHCLRHVFDKSHHEYGTNVATNVPSY